AARSVLDDELLTEPLGQPLSDDPGRDVDRLARGKSDDHAHRPCRVGKRSSGGRQDWKRGSTRGQMQKLSAAKFHSRPLLEPTEQVTCRRCMCHEHMCTLLGLSETVLTPAQPLLLVRARAQ